MKMHFWFRSWFWFWFWVYQVGDICCTRFFFFPTCFSNLRFGAFLATKTWKTPTQMHLFGFGIRLWFWFWVYRLYGICRTRLFVFQCASHTSGGLRQSRPQNKKRLRQAAKQKMISRINASCMSPCARTHGRRSCILYLRHMDKDVLKSMQTARCSHLQEPCGICSLACHHLLWRPREQRPLLR